MTIAHVRVVRDGQFVDAEIETLTDEEMFQVEMMRPDDGWRFALFLARWIRDNVVETPSAAAWWLLKVLALAVVLTTLCGGLTAVWARFWCWLFGVRG